MTSPTSRRDTSLRALQVTLVVLAGVAISFGALTVLSGGSTIPGEETVRPSVDSELRFFAAWYVGAGVFLLGLARRPEHEGRAIRGVCAILVLAAIGRLLSMAAVGRPHAVFLALTVVELVIPIVIVPWQTAIARRSSTGRPTGRETRA
jgi:hypothetical protein